MKAITLEATETSSLLVIFIMILIGLFGLFGTDIYAPSLPIIPKLFNTSMSLAQLTVSLYLLGLSVTQLFAGMFSDSFGRKPVLFIGLLLFSIGTIFCMFADSINMLLVGRVVQGAGAGAAAVLSRILLRDLFSGVRMARVGSYLGAFIGISPAIAPIIGGYIQEYFGFAAIFLFLLIFAVVIFYFICFHLPETNRYRHLHPLSLSGTLKKYKQVLESKVFWVNVIATGCAMGVIIATAVVNPFLLQNLLKLTPSQYGMWAFVGMFGMFVGMVSNGYFVGRFGTKNMMNLGMGLVMLGGLSLVFFSMTTALSISTIIAPTFLITLATAFIMPNSIVGAFAPFAEIAGTVGAVYGCLQMLISSLVSSLISMLEVHSQFALGAIVFFLGLISWMCYYFKSPNSRGKI